MNLEKIKEALRSLLVEFSTVKLQDGSELSYDGDELKVGVKITAEDGEYVAEDGSVIAVKDGVVESVTPKEEEPETEPETEEPATEPETEPETTDEPETEEPATEPETEENTEPETEPETVDYEERIAALEAKIKELEDKVIELLNTPVVQPIAEEFSNVGEIHLNNKQTNAANILSYMK